MGVIMHYMGTDIALPEGEFAIGRDPECRLCLADPIVSRRHAILRVDSQGATIEDLGSRNGVLVNRVRIEGTRRLVPGDAIVIGGQQLVFSPRSGAPARAAHASRAGGPAAHAPLQAPSFSPATTVGQSVSTAADLPDAFEKVARVASRAMAVGRTDEAERTLERALAEVLSLSRARVDVGGTLIASAARHAAYLAAATRKGAWVDYVFDLYTVRREPIPIPIADILSGAVEVVRPDDVTTITSYLRIARQLAVDSPGAARSLACVETLARRYGVA